MHLLPIIEGRLPGSRGHSTPVDGHRQRQGDETPTAESHSTSVSPEPYSRNPTPVHEPTLPEHITSAPPFFDTSFVGSPRSFDYSTPVSPTVSSLGMSTNSPSVSGRSSHSELSSALDVRGTRGENTVASSTRNVPLGTVHNALWPNATHGGVATSLKRLSSSHNLGYFVNTTKEPNNWRASISRDYAKLIIRGSRLNDASSRRS